MRRFEPSKRLNSPTLSSSTLP